MIAGHPRACANITGRTWAALAALVVLEAVCGALVVLAAWSVL